MSLYRYSVTRHSAHPVRTPLSDTHDPLEVATDARATELAAAALACRWAIARRRAEEQRTHLQDLRERATEASRPLP